MIVEWDKTKNTNGIFDAYAKNVKGDSILLSAVSPKGTTVGLGVAKKFTSEDATHPGWYVSYVAVLPDYRGDGYGYELVAELLRRIPSAPVYLVRPATEGRVFQGGFGFVPVEGEYHLKGFGAKLALFVAENPDPEWVR